MDGQSIVTEEEDDESHLLRLDLIKEPNKKSGNIVIRKRKVIEIVHEDECDDAPKGKKYPTRTSRSIYKKD